MKTVLGALIPLLGIACSITQRVTPLAPIEPTQICIVENPDVRSGFLAEYKRVLEERGYTTRVLPWSATAADCELTTTYVASWSWDVALYMSYAEIKVFRDGELAGEALYDARGGGMRLDKFIDAETKIRELVQELFSGPT